jgi:hemolysin activation/secretion protein
VGLTTPLGNQGLKLAVLGALTNTASISLDPALDLTSGGSSSLASVALRYPLLLRRTSAINLSLQGDAQNTTNNLFLDGVEVQGSDTRLRALRLGIDASRSSPFSSSYAALQISQGLPIWNAQVNSPDPALSNPFGSTSFISGRLTLRHQQRIGTTNGFITLTGMGQLAGTPLPSPEDFSYGGPFLGRAYRSSFLIADQGVAGGIEASYSFYPAQATLTPFVFYDVGSVFQAASSAPQNPQSAASVGIGLRGSWTRNTSFELGWAIPEGILVGTGFAGRDGPANSIVYFRAAVTF